MDLLSIILISIGLAMDCFAVSTAKGLQHARWSMWAVLMAVLFDLFQGGMPLIGYFAGTLFADFFSRFAPWIALALLAFIGGKMIWESVKGENGENGDASLNGGKVHQIVAEDCSLLTEHYVGPLDEESNKIVNYNRYTEGARPSVGYIRGFKMRRGAFAQTIAHDCHNIMAIGANDEDLVRVINRVIELGGGIVATDGEITQELALPIAGLISPLPAEELDVLNLSLERLVQSCGCEMDSPFITLGFMALPVIPCLKQTDKGLFDATVWHIL